MKINQLEKINEYVAEIKQIDEELNNLNNIAKKLVNNNCKIELRVENLDKVAEAEDKVLFDEDNSLILNGSNHEQRIGFMDLPTFMNLTFNNNPFKRQVQKNISIEKWDITDVTGLSILELLRKDKQGRKDAILAKLKRYKIEL